MNKNRRILKLVVIFLTVVQVVWLAFWSMYSYSFLIVITSFVNYPAGKIGYILENTFHMRAMCREIVKYTNNGMLYNTISRWIIMPIIMIVLFQQIKVIFKDIAKGTGFKQNHIRRIYAIAIILVVRGLCGALVCIFPVGVIWSSVVIRVSNGLFMGLVAFALAKIFEHGVEVQTDSDMTV